MKKIGITCYNAWSDDLRYTDYTEIGNTYVHFVRNAGAVPVLMPINPNEEELTFYGKTLDAIIFSGGSDIHPLYYDEPQRDGLGEINIERDKNDFQLMDWAFNQKLPIYGICRGCQLLNVYLGGTLYQDTRYIETDIIHNQKGRGIMAHSVHAKKDSKLYNLFGQQEKFLINSHHHQAAEKLGKGLEATLVSPDGVIEGLELQSSSHLVVATQFHPEVFYQHDEYKYMGNSLKEFINLL